MAKLFNPTYANQMFGQAFTPAFLQTQKLNQDESQFQREMSFQNRQLQLGEAFRRDELEATINYHNTLGNYYNEQIRQGDEQARIRIDEGKADLFSKGWTPVKDPSTVAPNTPLQEIYGESWIAPQPKPEELSRWEAGPFGSQVEAKGYYNDAGKWVSTNYETVISPPEMGGGGDGRRGGNVDISNEVGQINKYLTVLKEFNRRGLAESDKITMEKDGEEVAMDKSLIRANLKQYTEDMLTKLGLSPQSDFVNNIRTEAGVVEYGKNQWNSFSAEEKNEIARKREEALLDVISERLRTGKITPQEYEALRYWAIAGTK